MLTTSLWHYDGWGHGDFIRIHLNFGPENVNHRSHVLASISEITGAPGNSAPEFPFLGAATMEVHNIAPADGGQVDFVVAILWDENLPFRLNITIHNIV